VGPWYRWKQPSVSTQGRKSVPAIQKFASDDFVNEFLQQPQHSLKFDPAVDQVFNLNFVSAAISGGPLAGRSTSLYPGDPANPGPSKASLIPSGVRKLFLDTHNRHYLVVCELHCDLPGFPNALGADVCQAGFVVRKRYLSFPAAAATEAESLHRSIIERQAQLADLDQTSPLRPRAAKRRTERIEVLMKAGTFQAARENAVATLETAKANLEQWRRDNGVFWILQGWAPSPHANIGDWQIVEDEPRSLVESTFPLYSLFANPAEVNHDARGRAIFFGVVPTSSFDSDASGKARFDDRSVYEIRCFVREHDLTCTRSLPPPDCQGSLTWSEPTELFQLASHFDLEGTSNRPVTIQMPNLAELAAQAVKLPFGKYSPVRVIQPQGMKPPKDVMSGSGSPLGIPQICFFSIPLITIVAMFVLNIFLPIVILIFNLWFLLAFKFCIPPSVSFAGDLDAKLKVAPPDIDADFSVIADVKGTGTLETITTLSLHGDLVSKTKGVAADLAGESEALKGKVGLDNMANSPLRDLNNNNLELSKMPKDVSNGPDIGVDLTASLQFEAHVEAPAAP
jgi:hypothetical protein